MRTALAVLVLVLAGCAAGEPVAVDTADPLRDQQWGMELLDPQSVWATTRGGDVTVAVVDSGVDATQPDLDGRIGDGIDLVDPGTPPDDRYGHGTHVTGIIAGVAPDLRILPVRVLDDEGAGTYAVTARGIRWAVDHGADVVNLSVTLSRDDARVRRAVEAALGRGVVVVAAAGNTRCRATGSNVPVYPAAYPGVIGVGAVSEGGSVAPFNSCGPWVDVLAPGADILSIAPDDATKRECVGGGGTCRLSGTSEAAPWVAGAVALALALPGADPEGVARAVVETASDVDGPQVLDVGALVASAAR